MSWIPREFAKCEKCEWEWLPETLEPKACPRCRTKGWNASGQMRSGGWVTMEMKPAVPRKRAESSQDEPLVVKATVEPRKKSEGSGLAHALSCRCLLCKPPKDEK